MVYLSIPVPQVDGSRFQYANCGPAVCSELIDLASVGALRFTAPKIRNESGDTSGGIEGYLLASTMNRLTGGLYPFVYRRIGDWAQVRDILEHSSIGIIIDAGVTVKTKYRTNNFTGNHWLTAAGGSIKDGTVKYEDPGTTAAGWQRIPLQLLRAASDFGGNHWILESPATEDVKKNAVRSVAVRAEPDRNARRLGGLDRGDEVHVRKTTKGGRWVNAAGQTATGWHVIDFKGGKGYVKGEGLR